MKIVFVCANACVSGNRNRSSVAFATVGKRVPRGRRPAIWQQEYSLMKDENGNCKERARAQGGGIRGDGRLRGATLAAFTIVVTIIDAPGRVYASAYV